MAKTRSMTRNQNHDYASSMKRIKTCDNSEAAPWADLHHDLLLPVMMKLGVIDFLSFKGVCKSWRSLALFKMNMFMASSPPISAYISSYGRKKQCYLEDFEGRKFKTILPHSAGRTCVGLTCGYIILFGRKICDFWLVNPITRRELHFPDVPFYVTTDPTRFKATLVFSPLLSELVFVILHEFTSEIWFSIAGTRAWNHVSTTFPIVDIHAFKGKIYTINNDWCLYELILYQEPKLTLLETKKIPNLNLLYRDFASSSENLYVVDYIPEELFKVQALDFGEMKWVSADATKKEYALFLSGLMHGTSIKQDFRDKSWSKYEKYTYLADTNNFGKFKMFMAKMWYFPDDYLNANPIHE